MIILGLGVAVHVSVLDQETIGVTWASPTQIKDACILSRGEKTRAHEIKQCPNLILRKSREMEMLLAVVSRYLKLI